MRIFESFAGSSTYRVGGLSEYATLMVLRIELCLQAWRESWSVINRQGRDNIFCATILARMGIFDREYIRLIIDEANASPKLRAAATDDELIEGSFEMRRRLAVKARSVSNFLE